MCGRLTIYLGNLINRQLKVSDERVNMRVLSPDKPVDVRESGKLPHSSLLSPTSTAPKVQDGVVVGRQFSGEQRRSAEIEVSPRE